MQINNHKLDGGEVHFSTYSQALCKEVQTPQIDTARNQTRVCQTEARVQQAELRGSSSNWLLTYSYMETFRSIREEHQMLNAVMPLKIMIK